MEWKPVHGKRRGVIRQVNAPRVNWMASRLFAALLLVVTPLTAVAEAQHNPQQLYAVDLPPQTIAESLNQLARQTGAQFLFPYQLANAIAARPVKGHFTLLQATQNLLHNTGLSSDLVDGVLTISPIYCQQGETICDPNNLYGHTDESTKGKRMNIKNSTKRKTLLAGLIGVFAAGGMTQAVAQGGEAATSQSAIDEIIVTATKRETSLQDTALSINVLTGQDLEDRGITNVNDFINTIPGVSVSGGGPGVADIKVRGVGTSNATADGSRGTTATYLDEFALSSVTSTRDIRLIDVERIEVVKGPQGTLYGKSAMGGIVRYITSKPSTDATTGKVSSYLSNTADSDGLNYGVNGHLNIPLADNLAVRLVGYHYDNDGFVDIAGAFAKEDADTEDTSGGRLSVRWNISDTSTLDFTYVNQRIDSAVPVISETFALTSAGPVTIQPADFADPSAQNNIEWLFKDEYFNAKLDMEFDAFDLSVMASDKEFFSERYVDQGGYLNLSESHAFQRLTSDMGTTSFEARLVSTNDGSDFVDWIVGVWYEDFEDEKPETIIHIGPDATPFGIPATEGFLYRDAYSFNSSEELAIYGELSLHFSEQATLTLGFRRADVEVDRDIIRANGVLDGADAPLIGVDQLTQEDVNTYKVNFEYQASDDVLLYAQATSGYRAGGFNPADPLAGTPPTSFESDTLWNYEFGAKTSWLDNRLVANASVYFIDWSDIQMSTQFVGSNGAVTITDNVGEAEITGFEFELDYRATEYLTLGLGASLLDGEITALGPEVLPTTASLGDRLPGSAEETHSLYIDYVRPLDEGMDLSVRLTQQYIGDRLTALGAGGSVQGATIIPSFDTTDLRIGITHENGIEASFFVNNMFNNISYTWVETMPQFTRWRITQPKVMGLNIGYTF